jgi:Kelch motif/Galactose oxidase, central domain
MNRWQVAVFACVTLIPASSIIKPASRSVEAGRIVRGDSMQARRADHTSTLLQDGRVLITGGMVENGVFLKSAELFDPKAGAFAGTDSMRTNRVEHTATLLSDGKVLIAGGLASRTFDGPGAVASTEIYDPETGHFIAGPSMSIARTGQGAVLLSNHKVLIVGGADNSGPLASAEIYDPASNRFSPTTSMHTARVGRTAVLLKDGRVLVTGGGNGRAAEVYDPEARTWSAVGDMTAVREKFAATVLPDGKVLITGGAPDSHWHPMRSAEVFDPRTNKFTSVVDMESPRFKLPAAVVDLADGNVLVAGGASEAEVYDRTATRFLRASGDLTEAHFFAAATRLKDGRVLITGGYGYPNGKPNGPISTELTWIYQP